MWDLTMNINVKGVFFGCKYAIPAIRKSGGGSIINTASFVALLGAATPQLAYTSSKGAVLSMTRELAVIHARYELQACLQLVLHVALQLLCLCFPCSENIRVNALCPYVACTAR